MSIAPGGPTFTLTVNGTGFVSSSVVNWNGGTLVTTFVSNSQLTTTVPAANIASPSTASVTVVNPAPGGGTSNVDYLQIIAPTASAYFVQSAPWQGATPFSYVAADFNRDGKLDLAFTGAALSGYAAYIMLGNGDGTFGAPTSYLLQSNDSLNASTGDFNGDGFLDLAIADYLSQNISILLGKGDGTFNEPSTISVGPGPWVLTLGDFNADGKLDIAVVSQFGSTVSILLGNGDGTFGVASTFDAGLGPSGLATGDFNGDGKLDLAGCGKRVR